MTIRALGGAALLILASLTAPACAEERMRPPVGGVSSPADAMIFYVARGPSGACGPGCSEWMAAEGMVRWDSYKRLFALLDRLGHRKVPVVLDVQGGGDMNVAAALGRIIRQRGLDVSVGSTRIAQCRSAPEPECFALKRGGSSLDGHIDRSGVGCNIVCVLILAGGVHRTLPADASVVIGGMQIRNRFVPNVSDERQQGLKLRFGEQLRRYLTEMGVGAELADTIERNTDTGRTTRLSSDDWLRLRITTEVR